MPEICAVMERRSHAVLVPSTISGVPKKTAVSPTAVPESFHDWRLVDHCHAAVTPGAVRERR